jgi:hypothetical protein
MEDFEESVRRHKNTWEGFASLMLWSTIGCAVILILMAIFLL